MRNSLGSGPSTQFAAPRSSRGLGPRWVWLWFLWLCPLSWALGQDAPWFTSPFRAGAAAYLDAAGTAVPSGEDIEVLYDETKVTIDGQGRWVTQYYFVYRVLTPQGASDWDSLSCSWAPWYQEKPVLEARVFGSDKGIHTLAQNTIEESSPTSDSGKIYSDRRRVQAPLPAMAVGSIVEERITVRDTQPFFEAGMLRRFVFGNSAPTRRTVLIIDAPASLSLKYATALLPDAKVAKSVSGGRVTLRFDQGSLPALRDSEDYLPSDVPRRPAVSLSTAADWHAVAAAYSAIVDKKIGTGHAQRLQGIGGIQGSRTEKIDALVRWMAKEIRYTGIEFGDAAFVPHTPEETLERRYGDCKDKAALLVALLREAGVPADVALLSAGPGLDVDPGLPGMGGFDHAIVHVPGTPDLWIDPTDEFARMGQLPAGDQGRRALLASQGTTALTVIPRAKPGDNLLLEHRDVTMSAFGAGTVREKSEGFGSLESSHRSFFAYRQEGQRKDWAVSYADNEYRTKKVGSIEMPDPADLSQPFSWTTVIQQTPRATTQLWMATLWVRYEHLFERLPEWFTTVPAKGKDDSRKGDFLLPEPFVTEVQLKIVPPEGFVPTLVPAAATLALGPALLTETFSQASDGVISATLRFDTVSDTYTAAQAQELKTKILDLEAKDPLQFRFEPAAQILWNQGKIREAIAKDRELAALGTGAEHQIRYALALSSLGLGREAREEARKATERFPDSSLAWRVLGETLRCDLAGREYQPESDWAGAREALGKALALSPDDSEIAESLAVLDEYNSEGTRYGTGAPLDQAISIYRGQSKEDLKAAGLERNLAFALFYSGRYEEALKEAASLSDPPVSLQLACEALVKTSASALASAQRISDLAQRGEILRTAGSMAMNMRAYPQAADLVRAGAYGASATQSTALAAALAKTKAYAHPETDTEGPASAVRRLFAYLIRDTDFSPDVLSTLSRAARATVNPDEDSRFAQPLQVAANSFRRWGFFREAIVDVLVQMMQFRTEGSDDTGYRVRVTLPGTSPIGFLVVREEGEYRVADPTASPGWSVADLLAQIKAGRLGAVRQVLGWFRDEMPEGNGQDPDSVPPFVRFWTRTQDGSPETLTEAVALLMTRVRESARTGTDLLVPIYGRLADGPEKDLVRSALVQGFLAQERFAEAVPLAAEAAKKNPESRSAFLNAGAALTGNHQPEEVVALGEAWLKRNPGDPMVSFLEAEAFGANGQPQEAGRFWEDLMNSGQARPNQMNDAAWNTLFVPGSESHGLELGLQAVQTEQSTSNSFHTVACLFAVNGKPVEAKDAMLKAMDAAGTGKLDGNFSLVLGLIAEEVGLESQARNYFEAVESPKQTRDLAQSSYRIAQNHLAALKAGSQSKTKP